MLLNSEFLGFETCDLVLVPCVPEHLGQGLGLHLEANTSPLLHGWTFTTEKRDIGQILPWVKKLDLPFATKQVKKSVFLGVFWVLELWIRD